MLARPAPTGTPALPERIDALMRLLISSDPGAKPVRSKTSLDISAAPNQQHCLDLRATEQRSTGNGIFELPAGYLESSYEAWVLELDVMMFLPCSTCCLKLHQVEINRPPLCVSCLSKRSSCEFAAALLHAISASCAQHNLHQSCSGATARPDYEGAWEHACQRTTKAGSMLTFKAIQHRQAQSWLMAQKPTSHGHQTSIPAQSLSLLVSSIACLTCVSAVLSPVEARFQFPAGFLAPKTEERRSMQTTHPADPADPA